jgi:hypothetical protein
MEMNPTRAVLFKKRGIFKFIKKTEESGIEVKGILEAIQSDWSLLGCDTMQSGR